MAASDTDVDVWLRLITTTGQTAAAVGGLDAGGLPKSDTVSAVVEAIENLQRACLSGNSSDLLHRALPALSRLFHRITSQTLPTSRTSSISIILAVLRFYLAIGEEAHDAEKSLNSFFREVLAQQYADPTVADSSMVFLKAETAHLLAWHPETLPQYFPLILKICVLHSPRLDRDVMELFPAMMAPSSFLPLYTSLLDLPTLALALEDLRQTDGSLPGEAPSSDPKPPAPEDVFALLESGFIGSTGNGRPSLDSDDASEEDRREKLYALFRDLLKDVNDGLVEDHWSFPGLPAVLASLLVPAPSDCVKRAVELAPQFLRIYFQVAVRDVEDERLAALLAIVFKRIDTMFPDPAFTLKVQDISMQSVLAILERSPHLLALLKEKIMDVMEQPLKSKAKAELALHLCWAVGEHGGRGLGHPKDAQRLFQGLELLLYENLAASTASAKGPGRGSDVGLAALGGPHGRARLLCFAISAISKLATWHTRLKERAQVCLSKVSRSGQYVDKRVWRSAQDHLALMKEPAICAAVLGPTLDRHLASEPAGQVQRTTAGRGLQAPAVSLPHYLLHERQGLPLHDFSLDDVMCQGRPFEEVAAEL